MTIRALVARHFQDGQGKSIDGTQHEVRTGAGAIALGVEAAAMSGHGLDLLGSEQVLAAVLRKATNKGDETRGVMAVTNRRTILGGWTSCRGGLNGIALSLDHAAITSAKVMNGLLRFGIELQTTTGQDGKNIVFFMSEYKKIGDFYRELSGLAPQARFEPAMPSLAANDPTGLASIGSALWYDDPGLRDALVALDRQHADGQVSPEAVLDHVKRLLLAHRCRFAGPACAGRAMATALSSSDLARVLSETFGAPTTTVGQDGTSVHDFTVDPTQDRVSPALTALGIASYFTVGVGFSVGSMIARGMLRKDPIEALRVTCGDMDAGCWYTLTTNKGDPHQDEAMFAGSIHQLVAARAPHVAQWRAHAGWNATWGG